MTIGKTMWRKAKYAGLAAIGTAALGLSAATPTTAQVVTEARPNILFIVLDDVGTDMTTSILPGEVERMLELYGPEGLNHPEFSRIQGGPASTPMLDSLASESLVFANAWAEPFCSPSRAAMLTGLYPERTDVLDYTSWLSQNHLSLVSLLKQQDYASAIIGKWHLSGLNDIRPDAPPREGPLFPGMKPKEAGFDLFLGDMNGAIPDYWDYEVSIQDESSLPAEWRVEKQTPRSLPGIESTTFAPVVKVADTIDWIAQQESTDPDRPWFAWLAFNMVHILPAQPPVVVPNRDTLNAEAAAEMEACGGEFGTTNLGSCSPASLNRAMMNATDTVIGRLLDAVDQMDPNTIVIVIGDNGTGQYGRPQVNFLDNLYLTYQGRGKGTAYESGVRVPLIVRGPGIVPRRSDAIVHAVDMFSTIAEAAGARLPTRVPNRAGDGLLALDSVSLLPIMLGNRQEVRHPDLGYVIAQGNSPLAGNRMQASVRNARYKLLCTRSESGGDEGCEFYNMITDPLEEYPLPAPASCENHTLATPQSDEAWQYCFLKNVMDTETVIGTRS